MSHSNRPKTSYGGGRQRRRSHPSSSPPAAATTTTTNFENDKEYQLDSPLPSKNNKNKNNKKKHRDIARKHHSTTNYSRLSFISANETSTVLTEPAIKPTAATATATTTRRSTRRKATTSPLERANQLQGTTTSSSPDFEAIFLSQGLETTTTPTANKTKRGGGGGGGFVAKVKSVYSSIRNSISSPSPSSTTTTATNRKRARSMQQQSKQQQPQQHRPMNQQDSLGTVTTPPSSSLSSSSKKRKTRNGNTNNNNSAKKKKIVVDLVDDDADTDEDDNNKKKKPKSSNTTTVATHAQQDNNNNKKKKTTVYDTIATITESNKSSSFSSSAAAVQQSPSSCSPRRHQQQQQQQHETIKRTTLPASSRLHHQEQQLPTEHKLIMNNSSSSSSSFEEENPKLSSSSDQQQQQQQQRKEAFQAKVLEKNAKKYNNGDGPPVPTNFSTAVIPISTTTTGNHQHKKDDSSSDDDESTSLLPEMCNSGNNETARRSKTTIILQRAQVAAKTRPNPDMVSMLQQQYKNNKKKSRKEEEEEENDDNDDEVIDCTPEQEEEVITILDNSGCNNNTTTMTKPDGLQQRIPRKSTSSSSTNLPKDLQAPPEINSGGLLQQFDHERNEWNVSSNTDDVDWTKRSDNRTPPPSDDDDDDENMFGIKRKATTKESSSSSSAIVDDSFQLREMAERSAIAKCFSHNLNRIHNKLKNNNNKERRNEKQPAAGAGAGFKLGKHNNTVKRRGNGVRVVPGRSTLASERQESFERKDGDAAVAASRHFSNKKSPQSETLNWGMSSNDPARTSTTTTRQSDRIKQAQRRESLVDTDDSDQDNDEVLRQQEALIQMSRRRMMTRSSSKKPKKASRPDDPIVLSSDSEEEEEKTNTKLEYELLRISIGKKVFNNGCHLTFQSNPRTNLYQLKLCFYKSTRTTSGSLNSASKREELNVKLTQDTLKLFKVYNAHSSRSRRNLEDDEVDFSFLVLQILPCPETNDLCKFTSAYRPRGDGPKKVQYIVLQFRAEEDHADCCIKVGEALAPIIGEPGVVQRLEKELYAEALIEHSYKMLNSRHKAQSTFTAGRDGESILFVYPFAEDPAQIDAAADGLREASGRRLTGSDADSSSSDDDEVQEVEPFACKVSSEPDAKKAEAKTKVRQTFVTIRVKDYERLYPEEWLNDSLVDFWMQWISRNEDKSSTKLHFFTSHFYTTLLNDGPNSVTSWTAKKNINIFDKKFIFIPINKDLHWSLCVVVNPGFIKNSRESDLEKQSNLDLPCLIFMDSLNLHKKATVRRKVEAWLNSEYSRIHPDEVLKKPFSTDSFGLFTPGVPKQNNTWDCGVFVCRYAYAVFHLRNRPFTYGALGGRSPFSRLITGGSEFDFDMNDIVRFRDEFRTLVENLSKVYSNWKRKEQANQKTCSGDETTYNSPTEEQTGEEGSEKENIVIARDDSSLSRLQDAVTEKVADDAKSEDLSTADHARSMDEQSSSDSSTTSSKASTRRGKIAKSTNTTDEDAESYPIYAGLAVDI